MSRHSVRLCLLACALLALGCPKRSGRERIAYYERHGELVSVAYNYYPLKVAAAKGKVAVIDGAPNLGFKNSRVLLFDAKTGALLQSVEIPRGTRRDAKAAAIAADAAGRFYVAIEGQTETHLLRLTMPEPPPPPKPGEAPPPPRAHVDEGRMGPPDGKGPTGALAEVFKRRKGESVARTEEPPVQPDGGFVIRGRLLQPRSFVIAKRPEDGRIGVLGGTAGGAGLGRLLRPTEEWDAIRGGRYPTGIHAGPGDMLWLVDSGNQRIIRLAWKGTDPMVIGSPRELDAPRGLAVTPEGVVYTKLLKGGKSRFLRYDPRGQLAGGFDVDGVVDSLAWFHNDLRLDREGRLYVTDYANARIVVLRQDGAPAGEIKDPSLRGPMGIYIDDDDFLFVADAFGKQVLRFRPVYEKEAAVRAAAAAKAKPAPAAK